MFKRVTLFFSILFLSFFCFVGCAEFFNLKTQTEIKINLDLSKIIKNSRSDNVLNDNNSSTIIEKYIIKVFLYSVINPDINNTDLNNLELITENQVEVINGSASIKFDNVLVGINAIIHADLYEISDFNEETFDNNIIYSGNSDVFTVNLDVNKINIVLKKVNTEEEFDIFFAQGVSYEVIDNVDTFYISNIDGLATFRDIVNGTSSSNIVVYEKSSGENYKIFSANTSVPNINVILEDNIIISGKWIPIGIYATDDSRIPYSGIFDGNNKTISFNNSFYNDSSSTGLFQIVSGTVKNLVVDGSIRRSTLGAIGGITGSLYGGKIESCVNKSNVSNSSSNGTGGLVGIIESSGAKIQNSVNMGKINSSGNCVGGIVGSTTYPVSQIEITKCINTGEISGSYSVAGIFGYLNGNDSSYSISDCINLGAISINGSSSSTVSFAGIINSAGSCTIRNCVSIGSLKNKGSAVSTRFGAISSTPSGYTNCYYNSEIITDPIPTDYGTSGNNRKTTVELCALTSNNLSNWSISKDRYPLPDIQISLPTGNDSTSIWEQIEVFATPLIYTSTYSIGDIFYQNDEPIGIIFEISGNYLKILSLDEETLGYSSLRCSQSLSSPDNIYYPDFTDTSNGSKNLTNWYDFLMYMSSYFSPADFPAFSYCLSYRDDEREGATWYLPSNSELQSIQKNITAINSSLAEGGFTELKTNGQYWSSTYESAGKANYIGMDSKTIYQNSMYVQYGVRPCRKISLENYESEILVKGIGLNYACTVIENLKKVNVSGNNIIKYTSDITIDYLSNDIYDALWGLKDYKDIGVHLDLSSTNITEFPYDTFLGLTNITGITLPPNLESIDASSFQGCVNLKDFVVAYNTTFKVEKDSEGNNAILLNNDKTSIISYPSATGSYTIPEYITSISNWAFADATNLTEVIIHANLIDLPSNAFYGACYLENFTVHSDNPYFTTDESKQILLSKDKETLICWPYAEEDIKIPDSVKIIDDYALGYTFFDSIDLNNVEIIGKCAFFGCYKVSEITIPESVKEIRPYAFYDCDDLTQIVFENTEGWALYDPETDKFIKILNVSDSDTNIEYFSNDTEDAPDLGFANYVWRRSAYGGITVSFPSYNDPLNILTLNDLTFTADQGYSTFSWYVNGEKTDNYTDTFVIDPNDMNNGGIYTVMVIVEDEYGNMYSAEYQLEVTNRRRCKYENFKQIIKISYFFIY